MDTSNALIEDAAAVPVETRPAALLRGTARGLEIVVDAGASTADILAAIVKRLDEAPGFFRGSNVRIRVEDGPLPSGALARLDELAGKYELRIVEVGAVQKSKVVERDADAAPEESLASGSGPAPAFEDEEPTGAKLAVLPPVLAEGTPADVAATLDLAAADIVIVSDGSSFEEPTQTLVPKHLAAAPDAELATQSAGTRIVVGPVRSGVILDHAGHVIVFGDVNPGAEVRAAGNIVVLGRLRGTAHAGIGQDVGFILALRLEPQQLRIGRQVARAADSDTPGTEPEIAYGTPDGNNISIIVERYTGKLPRNLATSI
jgi:septum site-determining protein MinC